MRERSGREPDTPRLPGDDLQKIAGVGPVVVTRLAGAGITTYQDLAALTTERVADITGISKGRIVNQDWVGQARRLADDAGEGCQDDQRYETFHVELLINRDGEVRRTKVRHYQASTEARWPGWDQERLIAYLRRQSALDTSPTPTPDTSPTPTPEPGPPPTPSAIHFQGPGPADDGTRRSFKLDNQPTAVRMTLRVDRSDAIDTDGLEFVIEVAARAVGSGNRHDLGSIKGTIILDQPSSLELIGPPLPAAVYSLAADVTVHRHGYQPGDEPLFRHRGRGELLHVGHSAKAATTGDGGPA